MVTDQQARDLVKNFNKYGKIGIASAKAGMSRMTGAKYLKADALPSQMVENRIWRTHKDLFEKVWPEIREMLYKNPRLQAKTLFEFLQRTYPEKFTDGQIRTFYRRVQVWRATDGPTKEVFFPQEHYPGDLAASDFTNMNELGITIVGIPFLHLIYHYVLTYSNAETGNVCFSESFENLSYGFQHALWYFGGVSKRHRIDQMSAAVHQLDNGKEEFTERYKALLAHYGLKGEWIQAGAANENGDVEQRHYRFKQALDQALMIRGSRDFESREKYEKFIEELFEQLNANRKERLKEDLQHLQPLPATRLEDFKKMTIRVGKTSTVRVARNTYSVPSRLIGQKVEVKLYAEEVRVYYGSKEVDRMPRLRGRGQYSVNYRHIIDSLVRKPGAFENLKYRESLFPTTRFRMAYDWFLEHSKSRASKKYLEILYLAATESELEVDEALRILFDKNEDINISAIKTMLTKSEEYESPTDVVVDEVDVGIYDELLQEETCVL